MAERNFQFRQRLNTVHLDDRRDPQGQAKSCEVVIGDGWRISMPADASEYLTGVAKDLQDYLFTSMKVATCLAHGEEAAQGIRLTTKAQSPELGAGLTKKRSYRLIVADNGITICGFDERGVGQGCYYLEDLLNLREGPFAEPMDVVRAPIFSPRMIHSGWGIDQFPDPHLNAIAHTGMDTILVFVKGPDLTTTGYLDINNLIDRATLFGLDVYLYSYLISEMHPAAPGAKEYYETTYGNLMRSCPGAKGIVFVGESCEFPSKDEHTTGKLRLDPTVDRTVEKRPSPGWWPCYDYPQWLELLTPILRQVNPDLDIVFWTYNWGWAPEEDRLALIRSLPTDISLQATFEMFENIEKDGIMTRCVDYTASFEGPGVYFSSEAKTAHERGIPLYSMTNTAGLSWDIGVIPYQPIPFQWAKRYQAVLKAHEDWGLVGLMESHHYGWWPSFVNELAKSAYWEPQTTTEAMAERLATRDFGAEAAPLVMDCWKAWSAAWPNYVPANEDQYGPFRVGPAYPLWFQEVREEFPDADYAHFGNRILSVNYRPHKPEDLETEIGLLEKLKSGWDNGLAQLEKAVALTSERKRGEAQRMLGLGQFIRNCVQTTINTKRWWLLKRSLLDAKDVAAADAIIAEMKTLGEAEIANAQAAIPLVAADSRLGWEPSMEYMCDPSHLEWKVAQLRWVLDEELPAYRAKLAEG
ncbi:MAG: hypothetical protein ACYC63_08375 [Armatimonadota bacterium]